MVANLLERTVLGMPPRCTAEQDHHTVPRSPAGAVVRSRACTPLDPTRLCGSATADRHTQIALLACADACRRAAAERITAIAPSFGSAWADQRPGHREPITASMVAHLL